MHYFDGKIAFLKGKLDQDIYIKQPEVYVVFGRKKMVCNAFKFIKMSSKIWNEDLHHIIIEIRFEQSEADSYFYFKIARERNQYILGLRLYIISISIYRITTSNTLYNKL